MSKIELYDKQADEQALAKRLCDLPVLFDALNLAKLNDEQRAKIAAIDALLPQTQCGLCGHIDGCLPYAHAIVVANAPTNLCVPGGQAVSDAIAAVMNTEPMTAAASKWRTDAHSRRPIEVRAVIRENECIGCTKCIPACPVDAIIGTAKHTHSIITDLCTGCELCLAPCPVDCIDLVEYARTLSDEARESEQAHLRRRYHRHLDRVAQSIEIGSKPVVSAIESAMVNALNQSAQSTAVDENAAKAAIKAAKLRTQLKKLDKQLAVRDDESLRAKKNALLLELQNLS